MSASQSRQGCMIIKLDLEKAYDKILWNFLENILRPFHFPDSLVRLIKSYVMSAHLQILWNGEPLEAIVPICGLRQEDPLSQYLFLLCMERLSYLIEEEVRRKSWDPVSFSRNGPSLYDLFFVDDIILTAKANDKIAISIKQTLDSFCLASGLKVNLARNSCANYRELVEKVQKNLLGWKAKNLNLATRTTLIQSVTSALPTYTMHSNWIPTKVCDQLNKLNRALL
ncbi:hypothetical protein BUALT_Bualt06G0087600 [Buddleja alternifolia]|uniref:Reverse transcriptase domain-containing protein n=1 Tax=Buddleja alternifolia TaxID=168488 RepID=A0AAV6XPX2_9LAMI|nr:hypothetical protein BUALT_Bualt06G0087600 [Buddleja alternifolia]